uniref:RNase H type-1 domain-containing protein n=1 Tax=Araneus ventricosus TaxID=182803 RepID=A0A4Y2UE98_ARAVE|nr:hypothetical protein AVEN_34255-1 [Araneus ventricosus]
MKKINPGVGHILRLPEKPEKLRNPDNCSVFRSELLAIEARLEAILNENNYGAVWILSDSRSSIQHLKDWNNVGDRTGISILKLLRHIGVDHEVHLQWIPSHVDIYGNEVADNLAKQGTAEPLCSTPSLTFDEIYSIRKNKDLKTWRVPPSHDWYKRSSPGGSIGLACDRADQKALSRFVSGHLRSCSFSHGNKVFPCLNFDINILLQTWKDASQQCESYGWVESFTGVRWGTGCSRIWTPDLGDKFGDEIWNLKGVGIFSISLLGEEIRLNVLDDSM